MVRPEVTQQNVHLFIPYKVSKMCGELVRHEKLTLSQAIMRIYNSDVYKTLSRESQNFGRRVGFIFISC